MAADRDAIERVFQGKTFLVARWMGAAGKWALPTDRLQYAWSGRGGGDCDCIAMIPSDFWMVPIASRQED